MDANNFDGLGVLVGVGGLAVAIFTVRYNTNTRRTDRREKELNEVVSAALNQFKISFLRELNETCMSRDGIAQVKMDIMKDMSEHYILKETWEQRVRGQDESMKGVDHRIKRNSQNIYMVMDNMFDIMSKIGMKRKGPIRSEDDGPNPDP